MTCFPCLGQQFYRKFVYINLQHFFNSSCNTVLRNFMLKDSIGFHNFSGVVIPRPSLTPLFFSSWMFGSAIFDPIITTQLKHSIFSHYCFLRKQHRFHDEQQPSRNLLPTKISSQYTFTKHPQANFLLHNVQQTNQTQYNLDFSKAGCQVPTSKHRHLRGTWELSRLRMG